MLRRLLRDNVPEIVNDAQIGFRPPDDDWHSEVLNLQMLSLNIYFVDIRENRKLRSNARIKAGVINGQVIYAKAPDRVDCHYLITAWSPTQPGPAVEPTPDEHHLLYQTMATLMNAQPLNPVQVYGENNPILNNLDDLFKTDLPARVLPVEGFLKQPEFWGTMGINHRWRPALYLIITLPLKIVLPPAGPPVTTAITTVDRTDMPGMPDVLHTIGGLVIDDTGAKPVPVKNAWVRLSDAAGRKLQSGETDDQGRFIFGALQTGQYLLEARVQGLPAPPPRTITIPSPSVEYEIHIV
jgi:hypothetical protein